MGEMRDKGMFIVLPYELQYSTTRLNFESLLWVVCPKGKDVRE